MQFDWKALEKSMDAVDKAVTTYEHADHSTNNELDGIQSVLKYLSLKQSIIIKPEKKPFRHHLTVRQLLLNACTM